jgi:diaminopimelate epimerase
MNLRFAKYHGTGNDFVMIDGRHNGINTLERHLVQRLCKRHFGIGADGLIIIHDCDGYDFEVNYYNADGSQSLCGNGSRCAVKFAQDLGWIIDSCTFKAIDGGHEAFIKNGLVHLLMAPVDKMESREGHVFLNTGSPHHVEWVEEVGEAPVLEKGTMIRHSEVYAPGGTNVNFVELVNDGEVNIRTFERGVENETLACGTGAVAAALASTTKGLRSPIVLNAIGGQLSVTFVKNESSFEEIYLIGPAQAVFNGEVEIEDSTKSI